jgi:hypothetical protein
MTLTKMPKVGDEVFVTDRGFRDEIRPIGTKTVLKVGRSYLHVKVYGNIDKFKFDGTGDKRQELWDSEEAYEAITKRRRERSAKISKIKNITSDYQFGKGLRDEALDEIIRLMSHIDRITVR